MAQLPTYSAPAVDGPISGGRRADVNDFAPDMSPLGYGLSKAGDILEAGVKEEQARQDRIGQAEARSALVANSEIRSQYSQEMLDAQESGAPLEPIRERMRADLAKVGEHFTTKRGQDALRSYAATSDRLFGIQAARIEVTRARADAQSQTMKFLTEANRLMQKDPLYLEVALKEANDFVDNLPGRLTPEQRQKIYDDLSKSLNIQSVNAAIRIDPEGSRKLLEGGQWNLTPQQREQALQHAQAELSRQRTEQRNIAREEREAARERSEDARDKYFEAIVTKSAPIKQIGAAILADKDLRPAEREHLYMLMERRAKGAGGDGEGGNKSVERRLWLGINGGTILNADPIMDAVKKGQITPSKATQYLNMVRNLRDENNKAIGQKLNGMAHRFERVLNQDPRMARFTEAQKSELYVDFQDAIQKKVNGFRQANDAKGLEGMFDPSDKENFVGSREFVKPLIDAAEARRVAERGKYDRDRSSIGGGGRSPRAGDIPTIKTKEERDEFVRKNPPGTKYKDPQGNVSETPGKAGKTDW